jgi:hypothetical protein
MPRTRIDIIPHLDYAELAQRYRRCRDVKERSRWERDSSIEPQLR